VYIFLLFISMKKTMEINATLGQGKESPNKDSGASNIKERKSKNLYFFNHIVIY